MGGGREGERGRREATGDEGDQEDGKA